MPRPLFVLIAFLVSIAASPVTTLLEAQEFRVYSRITGPADAAGEKRILSRSSTFWHAGKVYDYIDTAGEVTVLEPTQRRFWILNSIKRLTTTAEFDELVHDLRTVEDRLAGEIREFETKPTQSKQVVDWFRFQLNPQFDTKYDPNEKRLTLSSPLLTYQVQGQTGISPEVVEAYCHYADWMCRLNYVLHPQTVFPTARLALNNQLRHRGLMPTEVRLVARVGESLELQATHELTWTLSTDDRSRIQLWESLRQDKRYQNVSLPEYQRALLNNATVRNMRKTGE